jgi:hypothetical protein
MRPPYSSFHAQACSRNSSLVKSLLSRPVFSLSSFATFTSVAMLAWSEPGSHKAL